MPSITPTKLTDLPVDVLKVVADKLQDGFSAGSLANVNATNKKLYEASKHALWEVVSWDEKSFGDIDLAEEIPSTWKDIKYIYVAKAAEEYFWSKLNQAAPDYQTRHQLAHFFFPNIQAIVETAKGKDARWAVYLSPNADDHTALAEVIKAAYRINSTEFAGLETKDFIRTVPVPGFSSKLMPPTPAQLKLMGTKPMSKEALYNRVSYLVEMRPKHWFRQPIGDVPPALVEAIPHGTMQLKNTDGSTCTDVDIYAFPDDEESSLNTMKSIKAYFLFITMTILFGFKEDQSWLLELECLDYDHFETWIAMMVSFAVLFKSGSKYPFRVHSEITIPMSGEDFGSRTLFTWGLLVHSLDEAGEEGDNAVPKRVTVDINRAVIPAFVGKVLRAVMPVEVGDDDYEVDLVDVDTPF